MSARRVLPSGRLFCNGINAYAVIYPFTVYGWSEITIAEWIYPYWPKANTLYSKFSMIGDYWTDYPSTLFTTSNRTDYIYLHVVWTTRKPDGTRGYYYWEVLGYRNSWVHVVRRFTADREISFWVNGVKMRSYTVPATEKTILEWNPDTATYPERYRRFVLGMNVLFSEWMKVSYGDFRIYDRGLTDNEILQLYGGTDIRNGLRVHLDFSECEGNIAYDKSGNGNHATLYNTQWIVKKASRVLASAR
ncbi:MAG: hypothetical protein QXI01_06805 [Nitrososphaerota archaeon]